MRIYLDDLRLPPKRDANGAPLHWDRHCRTTSEAIEELQTGKVTFISFYYHLGPGDLTGNVVAMWIEDQARANPDFPPLEYAVHSNSEAGARQIRSVMESAEGYWQKRKAAGHDLGA